MKPEQASPAYRIETERLVLEAGSPQYAEALKRAVDVSLAHLSSLAWVAEEPTTVERKIEKLRGFRVAFDRGDFFAYHVLAKDHPGEVAGGAGLMPRVGLARRRRRVPRVRRRGPAHGVDSMACAASGVRLLRSACCSWSSRRAAARART